MFLIVLTANFFAGQEHNKKVIRVTLSLHNTIDENIIATIKMQNNFCYPLKMVIFPILR